MVLRDAGLPGLVLEKRRAAGRHVIFEGYEGAGIAHRATGKTEIPTPMTLPPHDYTAYGLHFRSALALPFRPMPSPPAGEADVTVRFAPTPMELPCPLYTHTMQPIERGIRWEVSPGAFLLHVPGLARYLVTAGREIVIEPCGGSAHSVSAFLTGTVLAALLQQRGLVTFHAAAVATRTGAVLFAGKSGRGKSSLLAALTERGYLTLSDDVTAVEMHATGKLSALSAFPWTRLWADALDTLGWRDRPDEWVQEGQDKYQVPVERFCPTPRPLRAVYILLPKTQPHIRIERVPLRQVFEQLHKRSYRKQIQYGLGQQALHFRTLAAMVNSLPVFRVIRPTHPFLLDALADRIDAHSREEPRFVGEDAAAGHAESAAIAGG